VGRVLVVNCGSSSVKYQLLDLGAPTPVVLAKGLVERVGEPAGRHEHETGDGRSWERRDPIPSMAAAFGQVQQAFADTGYPLGEGGVDAIGHRVVHGGERYVDPTVITPEVVEGIRALVPLAPLHNPANLAGIEVTLAAWPGVPQVAVFDTAFHKTLPPPAFLYALPYELYELDGVRRYGFHGTSHRFVAGRAATLLGRHPTETNVVTLHLGNGCSACAVRGGRSVETSMGFTPLEGLVMGTRSGDVDAGVLFHLGRSRGLGLAELDTMLNTRSGLRGIAGANDVREINARADGGDQRAALALQVFAHRARKYVGAYMAVLGRVDGIVFTGGIGEHNPDLRAQIVGGLEPLGVELDATANSAATSGERVVSAVASRVAVLVVPTDEELEIARETLEVLGS
jgi:acetate kinase